MKTTITLYTVLLLFVSSLSYTLHAQVEWGEAQDIASSDHGNNLPRIVVDQTGNPLVIWGMDGDLKFSRRTASGYTVPVDLNPSNTEIAHSYWMGPDIASKGDLVYVVYKEIPESDPNSHVYCLRSNDGGKTFEDAIRVDSLGDDLARFPTVSIDGSGNPIVAFMKFETGFTEPYWAICRSTDGGASFEADVPAGAKSSSVAEACDCCPGSIVSSGDDLVISYRNDDEDIRDIWSAISYDRGESFDTAVSVDTNEWELPACPASGPDACIIGDSVYNVFMSGGSGKTVTYYSRTSLSTGETIGPRLISSDLTGISNQNFPRVDQYDNSLVTVWKQLKSKSEIGVAYRNDMTTGHLKTLPSIQVTNIRNTDVAIYGDSVYVVWQDNISKTVKFTSTTVESVVGVEPLIALSLEVYPNPSTKHWLIEGNLDQDAKFELVDSKGMVIDRQQVTSNSFKISNSDLNSGIYWLKVYNGNAISVHKLVKNY